MAEMTVSQYNNCKRLDYKNTSIFLFDGGKLLFQHETESGEKWGFDLLSEVGELWKDEVNYILDHANIVTLSNDSVDGYYTVWASCQTDINHFEEFSQYHESLESAYEFMYEQITDINIDNITFAWLDDEKGVKDYFNICSAGCCGRFDAEVNIQGRKAIIGCNYGH